EFDELSSNRRTENDQLRDHSTTGLGGSRLCGGSRRKSWKCIGDRIGFSADARHGNHRSPATPRLCSNRSRESALSVLSRGLRKIRTGDGREHARDGNSNRQSGQLWKGSQGTSRNERYCRRGK